MGFFDDLKAISEVKKIKAGGVGNLSISQVTNLIISLQDAQKNLNKDQYNEIHRIFNKMRECKTKYPMNAEAYVSCCKKIILTFDKVAPYEKYCGGNEIEFSFMMQDIRKDESRKELVQDFLVELVDEYGEQIDAENYIQYIIENAKNLIFLELPYSKAKMFEGILIANQLYGTDIALIYFDWLVQYWTHHEATTLEKVDDLRSAVSFMCGLLVCNKLVDKEKSDVIINKYCGALNKIENGMLFPGKN